MSFLTDILEDLAESGDAQNLNIEGNDGGELSIDLDSQTLTLTGGTGINTTGSGTTITFDIDDAEVVTLDGNQILTNKTLTNAVLNGNVSGTAILNENDMASNSSDKLATQQSIKTYVDNQITAKDLDVQGDDTNALSIDLDSQTLTLTGGTGINTTGSGTTITFDIDDAEVVTLDGNQILTNKTLTSPTITGTGTIEGSFTGNLTGNAATATKIDSITNSNIVQLAETQTLTNKTLTDAVLNGNVSGTAILNDATMASNSSDKLATQQSIKIYVDSVAQGLKVKDSCKVATTENINLSGTLNIDGVTIENGDRVLVKNQTNSVDNGIYIVKSGILSRSSDLASDANAASVFVFIESGTTNQDSGWVCVSDTGTAVVETDQLSFSQFSGAGQITAGTGMKKAGNTLNVVGGTGITVNQNNIAINNTVVVTSGNQTIDGVKTFTSTIVGNINGSSASCTGNAATATTADALAATLSIDNGGTGATKLENAKTNLGITANTAAITTNADNITTKQDTITGGATTIVTSDLAESKALVSDANGKVAVSSVSTTELGYVSGVTSAIQTQLNGMLSKSATLSVANGGTGATTLTANGVLIGNGTSAVTSVDMSSQGQLLVGGGEGNPTTLNAGTNDQVLTVDSLTETGLKWAAVSSGASTLNDLTDVTNDAESFSLFIETDGKAPSFENTLSGSNNIGIGNNVFTALTEGANNIGIGNSVLDALTSGNDNTCIGYNSGSAISTSKQNTIIGASAGSTGNNALATGNGNNIIIGYNASASAADVENEITLGNSNITSLRCADQTIASLSDGRDKTNVVDSEYGLDFVNKIRPVQFTWQRRLLEPSDENHSKNGKTRVGFIAQELQSAMPNNANDILDLVYEANPERIEAKYGNLIPILTKAIQELSAKNEALVARVEELEKQPK